MLTANEEQRLRFPALEGLSSLDLQARFGVIKHLNRLVTPLLNYVDLSLQGAPSTTTGDSSLSAVVHKLKGATAVQSASCIFRARSQFALLWSQVCTSQTRR